MLPELGNPYVATLAQHVEEALAVRGRTLSIQLTGGDADREAATLQGTTAREFSAVLLSATQVSEQSVASRPDWTPLVLLGERVTHVHVPHVAIDNAAAMVDVVRHLVDRDRRRIAFIGAPVTPIPSTGGERLSGFLAAMRFAEIEVAGFARCADWGREDGHRLMHEGQRPGRRRLRERSARDRRRPRPRGGRAADPRRRRGDRVRRHR